MAGKSDLPEGAVRLTKANLVSILSEELDKIQKSHTPEMIKIGETLRLDVDSSIMVDPEKRAITTYVHDLALPQRVTITWPDVRTPGQDFIHAKCGCYLDGAGDLCRHTFIVCSLIRDELHSTKAKSELVELLKSGIQEDPWTQTLARLDDFLQKAVPEQNEGLPGEEDTDGHIRLVYHIGSLGRNKLNLNIIEQSRLKSGTWGKGRKLSWARFAEIRQKHYSRVDLAVWEAARKDMLRRFGYGQYSSEYIDRNATPSTWSVLSALRGHDVLFHESNPETPLQIVNTQFELVVEERSNGKFKLGSKIAGRVRSSFDLIAVEPMVGLICCDWTNKRVYLCEADVQLQRLMDDLYQRPVEVPKEGLNDLLSRLTALEQKVKVVYPAKLTGETITAATNILLRVAPRKTDGGLNLDIWSRPANQKAYFEPGQGNRELVSFSKGTRHEIVRDLEDELACATECRTALKLERYGKVREWAWSLSGGDAALDFLAELQQRQGDRWTVEWANTEVARPDIIGELNSSNLQLEIKADHDWFGMEGAFEVGDQRIPLVKILDALRKNSKYVQLENGKWAVLTQEFRDRLEALADLLHRNQSKLQFDVTAAPQLENLLQDQQINVKVATEWRAALARLEKARHHQPVVPKDLQASLRDYQVEGFEWLSRLAAWGVGGCLADDMGLGKTVQTLAVLLERKKEGPVLVLAPVSVGFNWVNEITRFAPALRPHLYRDTERGEFLTTVKAGDIVVTSYGLLLRDAEIFCNVQWGTLVLDEAQFVKNSRTKTAQVVRDLQAKWRLSLTGTPVENQLSDLWSLFRATAPGLFGSWERFRERFADPIEKQNLPERKQALARAVRPFILRRTKSEVLKELPARTEVQLTAELSTKEKKLYEDARLLAIAQLAGIDTGKNESRFQVLALLTRLRQLACHPKLVDNDWKDSSAKLDLFLETVEELREGKHRALVFSQFTSHLALIREALDERKINYLYLDGQTPAKVRRERVEAFQNGTGDLFLISLKAGGTGLNLTGADYVIHMDPWWNPAVEDQATDRAHRIGQTKAVMVYRLVAKDTIEEKILTMHESKRNLVASVMDGSDQAGKLSTDELVELIRGTHSSDIRVADEVGEKPKKGTRKKSPKSGKRTDAV